MKIRGPSAWETLSGPLRRTVVLALLLACGACASANRAGVGGVSDASSRSTARDAINRAKVGGASGVAIGRQMDQQAKDLTLQISGATIERIGEGIQVTFSSGLLFDSNSDVIRAQGLTSLRLLATSLKKYSNTALLIVGHTDSVGTATYNQDLSVRRATSALKYLVSQAVSQSRTGASGRGELEPIATNGTDAGRQKNRRIEVAIFAR